MSITIDLWRIISKDLPIQYAPSGPEVFAAIIDHMQQVNAASVRSLEQKLLHMDLLQEEGEDVASFGDKVLEVARRLDGTGMKPRDLNALVAGRFLSATVSHLKLVSRVYSTE